MTTPAVCPLLRAARFAGVLMGLLLAAAGAVMVPSGIAGAATPSVTISPGPVSGAFTSGQTVTVSIGPNTLFHSYSRVVIIECADPDGSAANLPTSFSTCDGNTIQGETVIVQKDGSITAPNYTLYAIPNAILEEQANWQPVCNRTNQCVLFVGENQNDFSQPKVFSEPFHFTSSAATIGGGGRASSAGSATDPSASSPPPVDSVVNPSAGVSLTPASLAFTGVSPMVFLLLALGMVLTALGIVARRSIGRIRR